MRPNDWQSLPVVGDDETVLRRIHPNHYNYDRKLVTRACLREPDYAQNSTSYGASVFVRSKLANGVADLEKADPTWIGAGVASVPVASLTNQTLGVSVRETPIDCDKPTIAHAHASLVNVSTVNRDEIVALFQQHLTRIPTPRPPR